MISCISFILANRCATTPQHPNTPTPQTKPQSPTEQSTKHRDEQSTFVHSLVTPRHATDACCWRMILSRYFSHLTFSAVMPCTLGPRVGRMGAAGCMAQEMRACHQDAWPRKREHATRMHRIHARGNGVHATS
jgi:hypothetical protein